MTFQGENLVFLISQPRSGSTLLQRMLAQHPEVLAPPEPWVMLHPLYGLRDSGISTEYNAQWARDATAAFLEDHADGGKTLERAIQAYSGVLYGEALADSGKTVLVDKTPRYYHIADDLIRLFPRAKFVFLIRNPLSVLSSILRTWVYEEDLKNLHLYREDLVQAPQLMLSAMATAGERAMALRYEDLVSEPAETMSRLCEFFDIGFDEAMLEYDAHPTPTGRMGDPTGVQKYGAPSTGSIESWRSLANDPQSHRLAMRYLDSLGREVFEQLAYDYDEPRQLFATEVPEKAPVAEWDVLLKPESEWTLRERLATARAIARQEHGPGRSAIASVKDVLRTILRSI